MMWWKGDGPWIDCYGVEFSCPTLGACSARNSSHCRPNGVGCTATVESLIADLAIERKWNNDRREAATDD